MWETWFDPWVGKISWRRDRLPTPVFLGFLCGSDGKKSACNVVDVVRSLGWEDLLEKGKATHSVFLPGESHGQRSLRGYGPWGRRESDTKTLSVAI